MPDCSEKFFKLVAQAFQPVSRKQISRAQPGKTVPPADTSFSCFTGGPQAHEELFGKVLGGTGAGAAPRLEAGATKSGGHGGPRPPVGDEDFVPESPRFTPIYEKIGDFAVKMGKAPIAGVSDRL